MTFLEKCIESKKGKEGICETCKYLIAVSETALGCTVHDKLIMPMFPPYHGNSRCEHWGRNE